MPGAARSSSRARSGLRSLSRLHVDGLGVAVDDGHAHARGAHADRGVAEDLARLVDQLALLVGVVVAGREAAGVGERVEGDLVGIGPRRLDLPLVQQRVGLVEQLVHRLLARAGDGLVGGDHQSLDAGRIVDRLEGDDHLHRRAVGVGDDPLVGGRAPGLTSATTSGTSSFMRHFELLSTTTAPASTKRGAHSPEVDPPAENSARSKPWIVSSVSGCTTPTPSISLAGRALGGERHDLARRELALAQQLQHQCAHLPGGAHDGDSVALAHNAIQGTDDGCPAGADRVVRCQRCPPRARGACRFESQPKAPARCKTRAGCSCG